MVLPRAARHTDERSLRSGCLSETTGHGLTILIADDHAIVREGLKRLLEAAGRSWQVVEAAGGFEALEMLRQQHVDLAILDLSMPGLGGLEVVQRARQQYPDLRVMMLTMRAEEQYALRAFQAGACAYVTKDTASRELVTAVDKVIAGGVYISASLADRVVMQMSGGAALPSLDKLSEREREVFQRLVRGERPTDIAQALNLSIKTISTHKSRIQEKLQLSGTAALVRAGLELGLADDDAKGPDA